MMAYSFSNGQLVRISKAFLSETFVPIGFLMSDFWSLVFLSFILKNRASMKSVDQVLLVCVKTRLTIYDIF